MTDSVMTDSVMTDSVLVTGWMFTFTLSFDLKKYFYFVL